MVRDGSSSCLREAGRMIPTPSKVDWFTCFECGDIADCAYRVVPGGVRTVPLCYACYRKASEVLVIGLHQMIRRAVQKP